MNRYVAELVGTFVLVFASCGSAVLAGDKIGPLGVSLAFGLSLLALVYAVGPVSGCHINPAVTVGILVTKKMDAKYAAGYIVARMWDRPNKMRCRVLLKTSDRGPSDYHGLDSATPSPRAVNSLSRWRFLK